MVYLLSFLLMLASQTVRADILFEGYSKILSGGVHVGFAVQKYEFDTKKKQFIATSYLKTNELGGNITESLRAVSSEAMTPISYQYTTMIGAVVKTIDAKFEKGKMSAIVKDGKNQQRIAKDVPKGTFLSSFLAYTMLRSPQGLKPDTKYDYQAIAEEDASIEKGLAYVKTLEDVDGIKAYRVLNEFKNNKFVSYLTDKGEVLGTKVPSIGIATELTAQPSIATGSFQIPTSTLVNLFGEVPMGITNPVTGKSQKKIPEGATKQSGVPAGMGIMIKGGAPATTVAPQEPNTVAPQEQNK